MFSERKGFTLIELLIVVAIIGILSSLLIPNALAAMQRAKQKQTMQDIVSIATAAVDYVTDHAEAPASGSQSGDLSPGCSFAALVAPTYIKSCPINDQWGFAFRIYTGSACASVYGIEEEDISEDDVLIASQGHHGVDDGWTFDRSDSAAGLYMPNSIISFEHDLININGLISDNHNTRTYCLTSKSYHKRIFASTKILLYKLILTSKFEPRLGLLNCIFSELNDSGYLLKS